MSKVCKQKLYDGNLCNRELHDKWHCIFHSHDLGKKELFKEKFWKEFNRQKNDKNEFEDFDVLDFSGFIFPDNFSFRKVKFEKPTYFIRADFGNSGVDFSEAEFLGAYVCFGEAKFDGEKTNFSKVLFKGDAHFGKSNIIQYAVRMSRSVEFESAQFSGKVLDFSEARFEGDAFFLHSIFRSKLINFHNARFLSFVSFSFILPRFWYDFYPPNYEWKGAEFFGEKTDFSGAKFSGNGAEFMSATFYSEVTKFNDAEFLSDNINFQNVVFKGELTDFRKTKFKSDKVSFVEAQFRSNKTDFTGTRFDAKKLKLEDSYYGDIYGFFEAIKTKSKVIGSTKYVPDNFRVKLSQKTEANYPDVSDKAQEDWHLFNLTQEHPLIYGFLNIFTGLGKKPIRWIVWSLFFAFIFGAIYADYSCPTFIKWIDQGDWLEKINPILVINQPRLNNNQNVNNNIREKNWFTPYYFSIVTFTTLGFGDITPQNIWGEIFLVIEVIIGYLMLGLLIHMLALKLSVSSRNRQRNV